MLPDGRQSERALTVRRGVVRLLHDMDYGAIPEVTLASGRRADLVAIGRDGTIMIIEIKSSREDLLADRKWPDYRAFCDRLSFATLPDVEQSLFPTDAGLIVADAFGAEVLREAPQHLLAAATRKALLIRLARMGAGRLSLLEDPSLPLRPLD